MITSALLAAAVSTILLSAADSEGHPDHFAWTVTTPSGATIGNAGAQVVLPITEDGLWLIHLDAVYLHQSPLGPWPWVSSVDAWYSTVIFQDGFEDGTANAWK